MKILGLGLLAALAGAAPTLAFVEAGPRGRGRGPEGRFERMGEILRLSEEQKASWKAAIEAHRGETQPLREEGRELHNKLQEALAAESPDPAAVGEAVLALRAHRGKARATREALEARLTALLTPEQKTRFEALRDARGMGPGRRGFGPGRPSWGRGPQDRPNR